MNAQPVPMKHEGRETIVCVPGTLPWLASFEVRSLESDESAIVVSHWMRRKYVSASTRQLRARLYLESDKKEAEHVPS